MAASLDPYAILGIDPSADDAQLRAAHRHLAQRHHPDHGGSAERFAEVQEAYARIRAERLRRSASPAVAGDVDARLAALERELAAERAQRAQMAQAERVQRSQPASPSSARPSDAELGYVRTEDSFTRIIDDWLEGRD